MEASRTGSGGPRIGRGSHVMGALGGAIRGYELGVVSAALLAAKPVLGLDAVTTGWIVSSALIGSLFGSLGAGPLADRFGRRAMLALGAVLYSAGILVAAFAPTAGVLIVSRIVLGLAVGIATAMIPVYLSEIAPAPRRGTFAGLFQVMITIGVLAASLIGLAFTPSGGWRWMFGLGVVPSIVMLLGSLRLPESPRWLVEHGREDEARAVLAGSRSPDEVQREIAEIRAVSTGQRRRAKRTTTRLRSRKTVRLLVIGSVLGILQQLIGINAITYYAPTVLKGIGFSDTAAVTANVGLSLLGLLATVVMAYFVADRVGRRIPLLWGALAMALSMVVLAVVFLGTGDGRVSGAAGYLAVGGLAVFQIAFALSWGGIVWIVLGEMFPLAVRGLAMGIATFLTELASVVVSLVFPSLLEAGAPTVFFGFAAMGVLAFAWTLFMIPETKNRSLEHIEERHARDRETATGL
ncbi:sugar porter family MFS transporter [Amycolatopsis jiangsuensis]|uniref:Sugar porter (SP) family MFS transporter n=1 Tax=Amycolatopsis jiangsuensis TaxID=1181879 RepID=A0A840J721_9PSEU|nr:sugar porter family MFS transporter [Amycolatopsis jiangsuensis]MBB4689177.1 sugar porter (SP) family MFS transporter [Amycolatopsis jiangsuensis]